MGTVRQDQEKKKFKVSHVGPRELQGTGAGGDWIQLV